MIRVFVVLAFLAPSIVLASPVSFGCRTKELSADGKELSHSHSVKKIQFDDKEQKQEFTLKEITTKNNNRYGLVYSGLKPKELALYKIATADGKTKDVVYAEGKSLTLQDVENTISISCSRLQ